MNGNELLLALSKINEDIVKNIIEAKPLKVITLYKLFEEDEQLKSIYPCRLKTQGLNLRWCDERK